MKSNPAHTGVTLSTLPFVFLYRLQRYVRHVYGAIGIALALASLPASAQIALQNIVDVKAGPSHACALTTTGGVKCWGAAGLVGDGTSIQRKVAVDVMGLTSGVAAISVGVYHTCALTTAGGVKCWGSNSYGQLGTGPTTNALIPMDVAGLTSGVTAISMGGFHSCALMVSGSLKCWGTNSSEGRVGDGTTAIRDTPVDVTAVTEPVIAIASGRGHNCVITSSRGVKCWAANHRGQLGNGTMETSFTAVDVHSLASGVAKLAAGGAHTCALMLTGNVKCWGYNNGTLGNGALANSTLPVDVLSPNDIYVDIAAASESTCGLTSTGAVKCWGDNYYYQLGSNVEGTVTSPTDVHGLTEGVTALTAYSFQGCAVVNRGVKCWGQNLSGQLGNNTTQSTPLPQLVLQSFSPRMGSASGGDSQAVVRFAAPADDSGSPITGYTVISNPAGGVDTLAGTTNSHNPDELSRLITGLNNGVSYNFTVVATNALGNGLPSAVSNNIVPFGPSSSSASSLDASSIGVSSLSPVSSAAGTSSSVIIHSSSSRTSSSSSLVSSNSSSVSSNSSKSTSSLPVVNNCEPAIATWGATLAGNLTATDCRSGIRGSNYYVDRYSFSGVAGQQVAIQLSSTAFDTYLVLKNATNTLITYNDDGGGGTNSRIPSTSGTFTLPASGTYIIEVTSYSALKTGAYTLLLTTPGPMTSCAPVIPVTANIDTYGALATSDCTTGARGANYYADSYWFYGQYGQRIIIDFIPGSFDSYIFLRGPSGSVITSDTGGGALWNSRIPASSGTYTLPASGLFVIEVTSYLPGKTGGYRLVLTQY